MLRHLGLPYFADWIGDSLNKTLEEGTVRTKDIGGWATTDEFTNEVIKNM